MCRPPSVSKLKNKIMERIIKRIEKNKDGVVVKSAVFSNCEKYRYVLSRVWDNQREGVVFVGLNPSTADEKIDDPTIRRCRGFAEFWGFGKMYMLNLFAYRSTDPRNLKKCYHPMGEHNLSFLEKYIRKYKTVACYGNGGKYLNRHKEFLKAHSGYLYGIKILKNGMPSHPLYLKKDLQPVKL